MMASEFERCGLNVSFVDAVDGATLDYDQLLENNSVGIDAGGLYGSMLLSEAACYMSHEQVWRSIVEREQSYTLVCEDDIVFSEPLIDLRFLIEALPGSCDVLYLGYSNEKASRFIGAAVNPQDDLPVAVAGEYRIYPVRGCGGTYCYVITLQGARKILARSRPIVQAVDGFLISLTAASVIHAYALHPPAARHTGLNPIISQYSRKSSP